MNFLFSIITPIYKTPIKKLQRLYDSLISQTYNNWEWIVLDDSGIEYKESYNFILNLSKTDNRIKLYSNEKNIGIIGEVKNKAFSLGTGDILVEVDHDDELVNTCLENLSVAYSYDSEIGFVYGHCCEIYENSDKIRDYGDYWSFGYGRYENIIYNNKNYKVAIAANINSKTIRHITGIPNHVRSWKKSEYLKIKGHNKILSVGDDYELFIRTFLNTKIAKINAFTYIQYFEDGKNTQFNRNADIQTLVNYTVNFYNNKIHSRFLELNVNDYTWYNGGYDTDIEKPEFEDYSNIIIPDELLKNNFFNKDNLYGYSRVYNIPSTLQYKKTDHYFNIIKWLVKLTNCQSYLELGIENGETISEIKNHVGVCVGVDIKININPDIKLQLFETTTDNFFKLNDKKYDIIFIDADHSFEQLKKDFDNSLKILNEYGIIILHDTDPIITELTKSNYCNDSYKIVDHITKNYFVDIITLPIQETGLSLVMRKNERRVNKIL
jgi:glycosyltransferase involved in cell wall biosynthesis